MTPGPDPDARNAGRQRFGRLMKRMALFSLAVALVAAFIISREEMVSIHMIIATFILAGGSVMMASFLMGLIFYSNSSGHDDAAATHEKES
ncbi:hypothetical protein [Sphingomicrobium flavum]|uniref:hypothetical protein n=1 Tax=Sphingomicrobium flavum TaxID=1229164 RepID=UPI0021ADA15B|nr:hypothetical protein [Sphingomicrobium flavum]